MKYSGPSYINYLFGGRQVSIPSPPKDQTASRSSANWEMWRFCSDLTFALFLQTFLEAAEANVYCCHLLSLFSPTAFPIFMFSHCDFAAHPQGDENRSLRRGVEMCRVHWMLAAYVGTRLQDLIHLDKPGYTLHLSNLHILVTKHKHQFWHILDLTHPVAARFQPTFLLPSNILNPPFLQLFNSSSLRAGLDGLQPLRDKQTCSIDISLQNSSRHATIIIIVIVMIMIMIIIIITIIIIIIIIIRIKKKKTLDGLEV